MAAMVLQPSQAQAETRPSGAAKSDVQLLVDAYLRAYPQMTRAQGLRALRGQGQRVRMRERLIAENPEGFAGVTYDPVHDTENVRVTDDATAANARAIGQRIGQRVSITRVRHSYADLQVVADALNTGAVSRFSPGHVRAAVDVVANQVELNVPPADVPAAQAATRALPVYVAALTPDNLVEDTCTDRYHCGSPARSGIELWHDSVTNAGYCSLGFTARTSTAPSSLWVITAGHCSTGLDVTWGHGGQYFGPLRSAYNSTYGGYSVDVARIRVENSYWSGGGYLYSEAAPNTPVNVDYSIQSRATIANGDGVCLDAENGAVCGTVISTNDNGFIEVNVDACPGDSGGGWYWPGGTNGRWAYGIHHGSTFGCHVSGVSDFTAIPDINAFWDGADAVGAGLRVEYH